MSIWNLIGDLLRLTVAIYWSSVVSPWLPTVPRKDSALLITSTLACDVHTLVVTCDTCSAQHLWLGSMICHERMTGHTCSRYQHEASFDLESLCSAFASACYLPPCLCIGWVSLGALALPEDSISPPPHLLSAAVEAYCFQPGLLE